MQLIDLMDGSNGLITPPPGRGPNGDIDIRGLTADSRQVRPGFLFAALPGSRADGRRFIADAVAKGASAVLTDDAADLQAKFPDLFVVADANPRRRLALMAARFFAPQPANVVAVTGTAGKTSVAAFTRQIWAATGTRAASVGTLGVIGPDFAHYGSLTTPDPVVLHQELASLAQAGIDHVAIEASSHGLDQFRLDGLDLQAAAFTNLGRDHLDYHPTMADYLKAKARLFAEVLQPGRTAVLNQDAPEFAELSAICRSRGHRILSYGTAEGTALRLRSARPLADGQALEIEVLGRSAQFILPLTGGFQAYNALAALGLAIGSGAPAEPAIAALAALQGAPGRMQVVASHPSGAPIYVDYAHKPDALEHVLSALRPLCRGRLVVVFGCGGDRDPGKRPMMGAIADRLADVVLVTDDNPRSENPDKIRAAILAACPRGRDAGDRATAIRAAVRDLQAGDLLVIAGKGHETGQIVGDQTFPFDDAVAAREAVTELASGSGGGAT